MIDRCKECGANLAMVGIRHRCVPKVQVGGLPPARQPNTLEGWVKIINRNTPEASGTARKAPSGKVVSAKAPMAKPSRTTGRASTTNPVAKEPEASGHNREDGPSRPSHRGSSRLGAGRTAQDSPRSETAGAVAIPKRGRPKIDGPRPWEAAGVSRRSWYRRKAEERSK